MPFGWGLSSAVGVSYLTATERFVPTCSRTDQAVPPKNGKVLSIPVWFDSENTGGGEGVEPPNFCLFPVVGIAFARTVHCAFLRKN